MPYQQLPRSLTVVRMVESTLEDFCHRYLSTPDDLYLYNTSRVTAEGFAQFRQRVEHDRGPFQVGMPLEERAQIWMDVVLGANQTIQQAIDTHHNRLQTATETPITPEIVWRAAAIAPFREASLVQSAGGLNDDAPDRATRWLGRSVGVQTGTQSYLGWRSIVGTAGGSVQDRLSRLSWPRRSSP